MITSCFFGSLTDGTPVTRYRLPGGGGAYADILDYGGTIQALVVPDREGRPTDVVLGYDTPREYQAGQLYFGATIGRHANRIAWGRFILEGKTYTLDCNCGPNHSHGGLQGFDRKMFRGEVDGDFLHLQLVSPHGDQGYPGRLTVTVTFSFSRDNVLIIRHRAVTDQTTLVNMTSHSYFDLSGGQNPMGQRLRLRSDTFAENDENTLPTGRLLPAAGTAFDFTREKPVGRDIDLPEEQLLRCRGYDHSFVLREGLADFASLWSPETGIAMEAAADLPGVQLYSGNYVEGVGKGGRIYHPRDGVCLEPQFFPNAMALEGFQKPILRPGEVYDHKIVYRFTCRS